MDKKKAPYLEELKIFLNKKEKIGNPASILEDKTTNSDSSLNINDFLTTSSEDIFESSKKKKSVQFSPNQPNEFNNNFFIQLKKIIEKLDPLEPRIRTVWEFESFDQGCSSSSSNFEASSYHINDQHKYLTLNIFCPNEKDNVDDPSSIYFIPIENGTTIPNLELRLFFDLEKHKNLIQNKNLNLIVKQN